MARTHKILPGITLALTVVTLVCAEAVSHLSASDPLRVFEAGSGRVVVDASTRTIAFDGIPLADAQGVVGACLLRDRLIVAQHNGVVLVYDLPDPMTDGPPTLVQRIENVGRGVRGVITAPLVERALVLASDSNEILGIRLYDEELIDQGEVDEPAFVDHARFLDFLRFEDGHTSTPQHMAVGPQRVGLVTDSEILDLFHLNRSYEVLNRSPWPAGVARVDSIAYTGSHWVLAGLDDRAEPVLMVAAETTGPWTDLGTSTIDEALAVDGGPIAWLPGRFTIEETRVMLAIRGERAAVASWPLSSEKLGSDDVEIQWLSQPSTP